MSTINCLQPLSASYWLLKTFGLWPVHKLTKIIVLKLILYFLIDMFVTSMAIHNIINAIRSKNIPLFNWMTCILPVFLNWNMKIITLFKNRNVLFSILDDLRSTTFNVHSQELNKHIQRIDRISKLLAKYFEAAVVVFILIFCLMPFVTDIKLALPPSFNLGKYDVLYKMGHLFVTIYLGTSSVAYDILYMSFMTLCVAQLNILQDRLTNIYEDAKDRHRNDVLKPVESLLGEILQECVILHETING